MANKSAASTKGTARVTLASYMVQQLRTYVAYTNANPNERVKLARYSFPTQ